MKSTPTNLRLGHDRDLAARAPEWRAHSHAPAVVSAASSAARPRLAQNGRGSGEIPKSGACIDAAKLQRMRAIIPYYVEQVRSAAKALMLQSKYDKCSVIDVRINLENDPYPERAIHKQCTTLISYTQPMVSMGAINSRLLLEFLGLKTSNDNPPTLRAIGKRGHSDDIGIECYQRKDGTQFTQLDPSASIFYATNEIKQAWVECINFANQRLAHITADSKLKGKNVSDALRLTFETVPCLVECAFLNVVKDS